MTKWSELQSLNSKQKVIQQSLEDKEEKIAYDTLSLHISELLKYSMSDEDTIITTLCHDILDSYEKKEVPALQWLNEQNQMLLKLLQELEKNKPLFDEIKKKIAENKLLYFPESESKSSSCLTGMGPAGIIILAVILAYVLIRVISEVLYKYISGKNTKAIGIEKALSNLTIEARKNANILYETTEQSCVDLQNALNLHRYESKQNTPQNERKDAGTFFRLKKKFPKKEDDQTPTLKQDKL